MEIIDKRGYLESALGYIEKHIVAGHGLQKLAQKTGVDITLLKKLAQDLHNFSEKQFFTVLQEEIESRHSSISGADVEISGADLSIETEKKRAYILMNVACEVVLDGEKEDKINISAKILSGNNIQI